MITLDNIINKRKLLNNFIDIHSSTNLDIIKCYKKLLKFEGLIDNIGSYILFFIILLHIIGSIVFVFCEYKKLMSKVNYILGAPNNTNNININNPIRKRNGMIKLNKVIYPKERIPIIIQEIKVLL